MALTTVIIRWTGPMSLDDIWESEERNGLYLLAGKKKYERREEIQYCGITEGFFCDRINSKHHKLGLIRPETLSVWLGKVIYPRRFQKKHLEIAEHCVVSWWQPELNESKTAYYPGRPICFISQWYSREGRPRMNRPPVLRGFPDVLWWDQERWRTGRLRVWQPEE